MGRTFFIKTYGCQMNLYDEGIVRELLKREGLVATKREEEADFLLILTCAVRRHAERRALGFLSSLVRLKRNHPTKRIGILGCLARALGEKAFAYGADFVLGPDEYRKLPDIIRMEGKGTVNEIPTDETYDDLHPEPNGITAFLSIMRGCNNFCAYCIVPYCRGRERSRNFNQILKEAKGLVEKGVKEITLLGQNVLSYKSEAGDFLALLKELNAIEGLQRIRFLTSHPKDFSFPLIEGIANLIKKGKVCPEFHLPLQSGSNKILSRMGRKYTREEYLEKIRYLRLLLPDCAITTDILVGFPTEEREDFQLTLDMVERIRFDFAYMFKYSERPYTKARFLTPKVSEEEKQERLSLLITIQNRITKEKCEETIGKVFPVLIEEIREDGAQGKTPQGKFVIIPEQKNGITVGETYPVKIERLVGWTPIGNLLLSSENKEEK
jgi:tRNA-2-methylthio-N6-dimethylallyladenosine synthase